MNSLQRGKRRAVIISCILAVVVSLLAIGVGRTGSWRGLEGRAQGLLVKQAGPRAWNKQVVVVEVDEATLRELGWPIRRDVYAQVVRAAALAGARTVAFDLFFTEPAPRLEDDVALAD